MLETVKDYILNTQERSNKNEAFITSVSTQDQVKDEMQAVVNRLREKQKIRRAARQRIDPKQTIQDMERLAQQLQDRPFLDEEGEQEFIY